MIAPPPSAYTPRTHKSNSFVSFRFGIKLKSPQSHWARNAQRRPKSTTEHTHTGDELMKLEGEPLQIVLRRLGARSPQRQRDKHSTTHTKDETYKRRNENANRINCSPHLRGD